MDFGLYLGVVAIGLFGAFLGLIYRRAMLGKHLAISLLPVCLIMAFVFPIYPVTWGSSDSVIVFLIATHVFLGRRGVIDIDQTRDGKYA